MQALSWARKMLTHPNAVREFQFGLDAIRQVMTDPNASRDEKRKSLNAMVEGLSEATFKLKPVAEQIMTIINMKEEVCKEYPSSEAQVDGILAWLPRMTTYRGMLLKEVKRHRQACGLPL